MGILLTEFNDTYFRDIASKLLASNVPITHIVTSFLDLYDKPEFSQLNIMDEQQFQYADMISKLNNKNMRSLSATIISESKELENLYLTITDRLCFYPKTVFARKRRYYDLLLYWTNFFEVNQISTIIFPRVPHLGYGNIIYFLAKKKGIQTLILRETLLSDQILITEEYEHLTKVPPSFKAKNDIGELKDLVGETLLKGILKPSKLMTINLVDNAAVMKQNTSTILKNLFDKKTLKALFSLIHNPWDRVYGTPTYMERPVNWLGYYIMLARYYFKNQALLSLYSKISEPVDLQKKFVYFPLHYQPERTSLPEGGVFENQLLILDILAKSIPNGWFIFVKEHPYQFLRSDIRKENFRDENFYHKIVSYPNVKAVPLSTRSEDLIQACQTSVTLTGSTGWETLLMGKPCVTFTSSAWYSPCQSCFVVSSASDFKDALKKLRFKNRKVVSEDVLRYLLFYKNKFVHTSGSVETARMSGKPYQFLIEDCSKALQKKLKNQKRSSQPHNASYSSSGKKRGSSSLT